MKKVRNIVLILLVLTMILSISAVYGSSVNKQNTAQVSSEAIIESTQTTTIESKYSDKDMDATYEQNDSTMITLDNDNTVITGIGATYKNAVVSITKAGTYILTGTLDGQILIDATSVDEVQLVLNNVKITNNSGAALFVKQAEKAIITLADGSTNYMEDGNTYADTSENAPDSTIYADDDLSINGNGSLSVIGNFNHGIKSTDDIVIANGNINIEAINDGIRGKDSVTVLGGNIIINAVGDGITASNVEDQNKGWILIEGGVINITAKDNGFQAESALNINEGSIIVSATQDAYHCNNDILITGGTSTLNSGDDGMHANNILEILNGSIDVVSNYEGIEGSSVYINGGTVIIEAVDDGINAAGGSDAGTQKATAEKQDDFNTSSGSNIISISGGYVYVSIIGDEGDGLDSNGNIYLKGGTIAIDGGVSQRDAAIDINKGIFEYSGGTLASVGSTAMLVIPSTTEQPVITIIFDSYQQAGKTIAVNDSTGETILSFTPKKTYPVAMLSSPEFTVGETYSITIGEEKLFSINVDQTSITVDQNGNATEVSIMDKRGGGQRPDIGQMQDGNIPQNGGQMENGVFPQDGGQMQDGAVPQDGGQMQDGAIPQDGQMQRGERPRP